MRSSAVNSGSDCSCPKLIKLDADFAQELMRLLILRSHYPPRRSPESAHTLLLCEQLAARPGGRGSSAYTNGTLPGRARFGFANFHSL